MRIFFLGLKNRDKNSGNMWKKTVSVVVAARNEEKNIVRIMTALINQDYSPEMFEIIIADDDSQDETKQIVKRFAEKWENVKLVEVKDREKAISPKNGAFSCALRGEKSSTSPFGSFTPLCSRASTQRSRI